MLLSNGSSPDNTLYYGGALILEALAENSGAEMPISLLYERIREQHGMTASFLVMCLDWLYLAGAAIVNEEGMVISCS